MNALATVTHRNLATVDLVIIGVYFLLVFSIGLYFARKERTSIDYPDGFLSAPRCSSPSGRTIR